MEDASQFNRDKLPGTCHYKLHRVLKFRATAAFFSLVISCNILLSELILATEQDIYSQQSQTLLPDEVRKLPLKEQAEWIQSQLNSGHVGESRYFLQRLLVPRLARSGQHEEAISICRKSPPRSDDFVMHWWCLEASREFIPRQQLIANYEQLIGQAKAAGRWQSAVHGIQDLAWELASDGDVSTALNRLNEALELLPPEATSDRHTIKFYLGTFYAIYGDREFIQRGIALLQELKEEYVRNPELRSDREQMKAQAALEAYNIGIAYALHLDDYAKAIPELEFAAENSSSLAYASRIFQALSFVELGQKEQAKKILDSYPDQNHPDPSRDAFLRCYRHLIKTIITGEENLASCWDLPNTVQLEVQIDLAKRLVRHGSPEVQTRMQRQFFRTYLDHIEPEFRKRVSRAASRAEIDRLSLESKLKDEKIASSERIKRLLILLSGASLTLLISLIFLIRSRSLIRRQARLIENKHESLQQVLNEIDQGILKFDRHGRATNIYSYYVKELFGDGIQGKEIRFFLERLGIKGDNLAAAIAAIQVILDENLLAFNLNASKLPKQGFIKQKTFVISWVPLLHDGRVQELLLSLRDMSASMALKRQEAKQERLIELIEGGKKAVSLVEVLTQRLLRLNADSSLQAADQLTIARELHTIKGEARTSGLGHLKDLIHSLEAAYLDQKQDEVALGWQAVEEEVRLLEEAKHQLRNILDASITQDLMERLLRLLDEEKRRLAEHGLSLRWKIQWEEGLIPAAQEENFFRILLHAISNAVDHGYLRPFKDNRWQKKTAELAIRLFQDDQGLCLQIEDAGAGIAWHELAKLANIQDAEPTEKNLNAVLFETGISTANEATDTSGHGLGLSAIGAIVKTMGASVYLQNRKDGKSGSKLEVIYPLDSKSLPSKKPA